MNREIKNTIRILRFKEVDNIICGNIGNEGLFLKTVYHKRVLAAQPISEVLRMTRVNRGGGGNLAGT